jgi:broad-specificity NMP kinase
MSGVGKSSVVRELTARGYQAVDTDDGWCDVLPDGRQAWREDAVEQLLDTENADVLFVAGYEEYPVRFHPRFDHIVLLTAPLDTLLERVATRTDNPYGKAPEERRRILEDLATVEPLLRRVATHEIRTTAPLEEVVAEVLDAVGE